MTKPDTPLQLISTIVNCLTVLVEGDDVDPLTRAAYAIMRDLAVNIALDLQTERSGGMTTYVVELTEVERSAALAGLNTAIAKSNVDRFNVFPHSRLGRQFNREHELLVTVREKVNSAPLVDQSDEVRR